MPKEAKARIRINKHVIPLPLKNKKKLTRKQKTG